jgi:hypothetical protein
MHPFALPFLLYRFFTSVSSYSGATAVNSMPARASHLDISSGNRRKRKYDGTEAITTYT